MYELCHKMRQNDEMKTKKMRLAIFDSFKTKRHQITGEAIRQRAIIHHLSNSTNSASKTRTAISQNIAEKNNILVEKHLFRNIQRFG